MISKTFIDENNLQSIWKQGNAKSILKTKHPKAIWVHENNTNNSKANGDF